MSNQVEYKISDVAQIGRGRVISTLEISKQECPTYPVYSSQTSNNGIMGYLDTYDFEGEYITWTTDGANAGTVFYRNGKLIALMFVVLMFSLASIPSGKRCWANSSMI